jgi:hypothetical protein
MSIRCPNCGHEEEDGAFFCSQCNTKLVDEKGMHTMSITNPQVGGLPTDRLRQAEPGANPDDQTSHFSLHLVRSGHIIALNGTGEFIIGRVSEGQSILPDVDLEPYNAYELGVSRLHALVLISANEVSITDLGSSNGTLVNKQPIPPHKAQRLNHKDMIRLGRFDVQALMDQS